ncbi:9949_t:CDS:1, partial [Paraglomus occultum]
SAFRIDGPAVLESSGAREVWDSVSKITNKFDKNYAAQMETVIIIADNECLTEIFVILMYMFNRTR